MLHKCIAEGVFSSELRSWILSSVHTQMEGPSLLLYFLLVKLYKHRRKYASLDGHLIYGLSFYYYSLLAWRLKHFILYAEFFLIFFIGGGGGSNCFDL